jgi:septum formation protein
MLGLEHQVRPADVDETVEPGETAAAHVERLAREKAVEVARGVPEGLVLGGDTVVVRDGEILGKPADPEAAMAMLLSLAGRSHEVLTGSALAAPGGAVRARVDRARVHVRPFGPSLARAYVATGEPMDKAGSYGIQGLGASLVGRVEGDYYTVVGLSVAGLLLLLEEMGWRYVFGDLEPLEETSGTGRAPDVSSGPGSRPPRPHGGRPPP